MKLDTSSFLSKLRQHNGVAIWTSMDSYVSYRELVEIVDTNIQRFKELGYSSSPNIKGQQAVIVDVSLSWPMVPIMLAAIVLRITVIPIDRKHDSLKIKEIKSAFPNELVLDSTNVSPSGRIIVDRIVSTQKNFHEELFDVALLLYTSGTTGTPKGVMLTYENIWSNVSDILEYFHLEYNDRLYIMRPLIHVSAITGELLPALSVGCSLFLKQPDESPLGILKSMEKLSTTVLCAAPTIVGRLLSMAGRYDLSALRVIVLSGEVLNHILHQRIASGFPNTNIWNVYGLTEAAPRVSYWNGDSKSFESGCVGLPLKSVTVRIVDDNGKPVEAGTEGELVIRGPNVMKGYFKDPISTTSKYKDGWLYTSDRASIRKGLLYVHGRKDDLIIRSGMNVYPSEIEERLLLHSDINEAYVFAKKNKNGETKIYARLVGKPSILPQNIFRFLIESKVEPRLWPDVIEITRSLSDTTSGKIKRIR